MQRITWYVLPSGEIGYFDPYDKHGRFRVGDRFQRLAFGQAPRKLTIKQARELTHNEDLASEV